MTSILLAYYLKVISYGIKVYKHFYSNLLSMFSLYTVHAAIIFFQQKEEKRAGM